MIAQQSLLQLAAELGVSCSIDECFSQVSTDSRSIESGELFVALSGDRFDGNDFVVDAYRRGACAAVVSRPLDCAITQLVVEDVRAAYGVIARINRRLFTGQLIGITGSAGKTSCKNMLVAMLAELGPVLSTQGNDNNEVGVPKTLLSIEPQHRFAVVEMGARSAGDIAYLTALVEPNIALVTNAMAVHIEGFGNLDTVARTKGELYAGLTAQASAIINKDDDYYSQWLSLVAADNAISFSLDDSAANCYAANIFTNKVGGSQFDLHLGKHCVEVSLALLGQHNVGNAVAAAAAAMRAGASAQHIQRALAKIEPVPGRLQSIVVGPMTVIDDSYNASPGSVRAAIDVLAGFSGRRVLVLGTMGELGEQAAMLHQQVAHYAAAKGIDQLMAVGVFTPALLAGFGEGASGFDDMEQLLTELDQLSGSDYVLVKGSRSARMERVVAALVGSADKVRH